MLHRCVIGHLKYIALVGLIRETVLQATATDQSSGQVEIAVLGMPDVVIQTLPREFEHSPSFVIAATALPCSTDPPASIRFRSFQL